MRIWGSLILPFPTQVPLSLVCASFLLLVCLVWFSTFLVIWSIEFGAVPLGKGGLCVLFQTCFLR